MKCPPLEIPDRLASALETGDLVVFAGAGVSMGPPTNLPSFNGLAEEIAKRYGIKEIPEKNLDQFLAIVRGKGHDIHDVCRSIIGGKGPPNEIHELILRLFKRTEEVRIVTSNFDTCFSEAAEKLRPGLQVFAAPALPLGSDFRGIVHLHGSFTDPESRRMVLTSDDFGHAYLTKGWALRFLLDLYSRFTVLFIGYSHSDPILDYLAFGLGSVAGTNRYAIHHGPAELWSSLGIDLIPYKITPDPDRHVNLRDGLRSWVAEVERTPLELEKRLDKVLHASSEPSPEDEDFLFRSMRTKSSAFQFVRYAQDTGLRWIQWLNSKGLLKDRLHLDSSDDKGAVAVSHWIGRNLVQTLDGAGLSLVEIHDGSVGSIVWDRIANELARADSSLIGTPQGQRWLTVLLSEQAIKGNNRARCILLQKAVDEDLWPSAFLLFDIVVEPYAKLVPGFPIGKAQEIDIEIVLKGDVQHLLVVWRESLSRALPEIAESLAPILEAKIEAAHRIAIHDGSGNRVRARILFARHRIELADEPIYSRGIDVLLYFFAGTLRALNQQRKGATADWADRLLKSENPILNRFGLYVLRECGSLTSSQKLSWLIDRSLFYPEAYGGTSEVFELLKAIYGDLTAKEKELLWQKLDESLPPLDREDPEAEIQREQIDRVGWHLAKANSEDPEAIAARDRIAARNPRLAKHDSWLPGQSVRSVDGPSSEVSPRTSSQLLSAQPADNFDLILDFKGHWPQPSREGLLAAVAAAARQNKDWCVGLMKEMAKKGIWSSDVWTHLFWAIRLADLPTDDQKWFLSVAAPELTKVDDILNALARFCFHGQTVEELRGTSLNDLEAKLAFSLNLWKASRKIGYDKEEDPFETDWVNLAINRAPGWIVEFWLMNQQLQVERAGDESSQWPVILGNALNEIISGEYDADLLGLSLIATYLAYVRRSDPKWTKEKLYPTFDFELNVNRAWVAWSSLILHGSWDRDTVFDLKSMIQASCGRLAGGPAKLARQFVILSSTITASGLFDVNSDGWIARLIASFNPEQRALWTLNLARQFKKIPSEDRLKAWKDWVKDYWRNRLAGSPEAIGPEESEGLIGLAVAFEEVFPEAVSLLVKGPRPALKHFIPYEFADSKLPEMHPEAFLDAINWVLSSMADHVLLHSALENLLSRLPRRSSLLPRWITYCQNLSRLNVEGAVKLEAEGREWFRQTE